MRAFAYVFSILCVLLIGVSAQAEQIAVPSLKTRVTDLTSTLSAEQTNQLTQKLSALEKAKGSQIAILILPTTGEEGIEEFAIRVVDEWKLGRKGIDDGALLLIAKNDKKVRIEVGRGLEGALPDIIASRIIREHIRPAFKEGKFAEGIDAGLEKMISVINGEILPEPVKKNSTQSYQEDLKIFGITPWGILIVLGLGWLAHFIIPRWIARGTAGAAGIATAMISGAALGPSLIIGVAVALVLVIISNRYFWDFLGIILQIVSAFSGRGGDSDTFSGGGGGFGGGGASGDW
jgi:uncharacterized protein